MTKENADALKVLTETINRLADEAVDQADYDRTRNVRIIKVYYAEGTAFTITGYDIEVDGKVYYFPKQSGKGIMAKKDDIVKMHIPCNNMNNAYLSYPHDPEDFIKYFTTDEGSSYYMYWNSSRFEQVISYELFSITFPPTTNQFNEYVYQLSGFYLPQSLRPYTFTVTADNGVWGVVQDYNVMSLDNSAQLNIKFYNQGAVTKNFNIYIKAMGIVPNL